MWTHAVSWEFVRVIEATSSLDAINEVAVQQAIAELVRGKTVVVVAHRLNSIREVVEGVHDVG